MGGIQSCALAGTGLVETAVVAHPGPLNKEDFEKVTVPISFICAEGVYVPVMCIDLRVALKHILCDCFTLQRTLHFPTVSRRWQRTP